MEEQAPQTPNVGEEEGDGEIKILGDLSRRGVSKGFLRGEGDFE